MSKRMLASCAAGLVALAAAGCERASENPVIFGQGTSVGISIGQSPTTQMPEFVLGYRDANIAFLPTVATDGNGDVIPLGGQSGAGAAEFTETYSVLGQFEVSSPTATAAAATAGSGAPATGAGRVGLGKFFATGLAAQKLAAGFACALSDGKDLAHCHPPSN